MGFQRKDNPLQSGCRADQVFYNQQGAGGTDRCRGSRRFRHRLKDKRAFVASLVAATTGARQGECLALRRSDIGTDTINIAHSYSALDGLKCPKNGHRRIVPLLPKVRAALLDLLEDSPHGGDDPFLFFSLRPDKPADPRVVLEGLKEALTKINVDRPNFEF